jgi:ornithine--oxo-acid transaminase
MNTSVEACQTAVKLAHRWAYEIKGVKANKSKIVFASENRIEASVSNSDFIPFNDVKALEVRLNYD